MCHGNPKTRGITKNLKSVRHAKEKSSFQFYIIKSQFSYCPLVWMFCSGKSNSLMNNIYERTLSIIYDDHNCFYSQLLMTKNERVIHQQNVMKEIYKLENDLSPPLIDHIFQVRKINYELWRFPKIANTKISH